MSALIHIGLSTHHQDQVIYPISFKTIKAMVKSPAKPIPEEEELETILVAMNTPILKVKNFLIIP